MSIQRDDEEVAKANPERPNASRKLKPSETLLDRSDAPTRIRAQSFDGRLSHVVEGTDVAQLHRTPLSLLDPTQREALGSANVRALVINSTGPVFVEKGARPHGVWNPGGQQCRVTATNGLRLDLENGQLIRATRTTSLTALKALRMDHMQAARLASDVRVKRGNSVDSANSDTPRK
jgi:hypothetical protein